EPSFGTLDPDSGTFDDPVPGASLVDDLRTSSTAGPAPRLVSRSCSAGRAATGREGVWLEVKGVSAGGGEGDAGSMAESTLLITSCTAGVGKVMRLFSTGGSGSLSFGKVRAGRGTGGDSWRAGWDVVSIRFMATTTASVSVTSRITHNCSARTRTTPKWISADSTSATHNGNNSRSKT